MKVRFSSYLWNYYQPSTLKEAIQDFGFGDSFEWYELRMGDYEDDASPFTRYWLGGFFAYLGQWYYRLRYSFFPCDHPNWEDDSYGGPDSGGDGGSCPDCGFSFWHQYY